MRGPSLFGGSLAAFAPWLRAPSFAARVVCLRRRFHLFPNCVNVFTGSHHEIYRPNEKCAEDNHDEEPYETLQESKTRAAPVDFSALFHAQSGCRAGDQDRGTREYSYQ